jgi:hypothetical protein
MTGEIITYGPNTAEVEALIARAKSLTAYDAARLAAAFDTVQADEADAAHRQAAFDEAMRTPIGADDGLRDAIDAVRDAVYEAVPEASWHALLGATDAAVALVVRRHIAPASFGLLARAWAVSVGATWDGVPQR